MRSSEQMSRCSRVCGMTDSSAHSGQHVLHEPFVTRHVDEADGGTVVEAEVGEPDVDGDAAFLLLLQPVCVDSRQRLDERGLAVIDVAGGSDDDVGHRPLF